MRELFVVYDGRCGLCTQLQEWLVRQPAYVPLRPIAKGSAEVLRRFPTLPAGELAVISDLGEVWSGDRAWIICLWALRESRNWATRLASPLLLPMARQAFAAVSRNRTALSHLLGFESDAAVRKSLEEVEVPPCQIEL